MAFADPQSVTISTGALSLPRTGSGPANGSFKTYDATNHVTAELLVSHAYGKRTRRTARLNLTKVAADPFNSSLNANYSSSIYVVVDHPLVGFTPAELHTDMTGLTTWLTASSGAAIDKLLGGES